MQARDQTCRSPGCATDATGCDLDHTLPVTQGGQTRADHLGALCRRDHTATHDPDMGWTVHQTCPGRFEWTSPTGRTHIKAPERYRPPPAPIPRTDDDHAELPGHTAGSAPPGSHPPGSPRRNRYGYLTDAALAAAARLRHRGRQQPEPEPGPDDVSRSDPHDRFPEEPPF